MDNLVTPTKAIRTDFNRQRWTMLLLTIFCYLFFYTGRHNFGWAAKPLAEELGISYEKVGWISFCMLIGYGVGQFINGNLADRLSPKHMIALGGLLSVLMNVLISFSSSFTMILILWTLNGYFQSMAWAAGSRIISNWWQGRERGLAFGFYTMGAGMSSIITYLFSLLLLNQDWRNLFRIPVLFLLIAVIIFFIFVRNKPADMGISSDIEEIVIKPDWWQSYKTVLANKRFRVVCISLGFQSMARYGLIFWIPLYFLSKDLADAPSQIWISLLLPVGMAIGAASFGLVSDRLFNANRIISISIGMGLCALVAMILYNVQLENGVVIGFFVFCAGFFAYGPQANFWPLSPEMLGHQYVGTGVGIMNMCAYFFAALGEPLMGKFIDITGDKSIIFALVALIALLSAATILLTYLVKSESPNELVSGTQLIK